MATKRKKKKPPGGATGAPPRSEPRVQIFTKFAGCNFQLSTRDFDNLFGEDQDAQTDLIPLQMAIQNNAKIAPFGGIETRQNLVELFDAPTDKCLTGVATLIGEELYAACDDSTVHYGTLSHGDLDSSVSLVDSNDTYSAETEYTYSGHAAWPAEAVAAENTTATTLVHPYVVVGGHGVRGVWQTFPITAGSQHCGVTWKLKTTAEELWTCELYETSGGVPIGATVIAHEDVLVPASTDGEVRFTWNERLAAGTYAAYLKHAAVAAEDHEVYVDAGAGYASGQGGRGVPWAVGVVAEQGLGADDATVDFYFKSWEQAAYHFESTHTVVTTGLLTKVRYDVRYASEIGPPHQAHVHVYHGTTGTPLAELIYEGDVTGGSSPGTDIMLLHEVTHDDVITMIVTPPHEFYGAGADDWSTSFFESVENNIWTFLGYADDQLVGMTANQQIWNGDLGDHELANQALVTDPASALAFSDLLVVDAGASPLTIHETADATNVFRLTLSYTILTRFGPTLPSPPLTFYASKPTTEWTTASFVQVDSTVANIATDGGGVHTSAGIVAVELYYTEGEYQEPAFLGRVNIPDITTDEGGHDHPPTTKPWVFNWTGYQTDTSMWTIANLTPPTANYTMGVPASKMAVLDGTLYFWGNTTYPYRIWIGGQPGNRFSVAPGTGGGFVDVEPGTGTMVSDVLKFKTQQGAAIVTALCDNPNSQRENRFNLVESTIAISDEQSVKGWMAEKIAGAVGCKSSRGAVVGGDGLYTISRYGLAITTLTMEYNSQLQVMYISDPISPVFLKQYGNQLDLSVLFAVNGVLYMTFGTPDDTLDNVIFCYDIALKAWWTYTLDTEDPILNMIHIDYEGAQEGIGIITANHVYLLPTTIDEAFTTLPAHEILIESGELTTMQPLQSMHHLAQLEFRFDYFIGDMNIEVTMIDQFGRTITTNKAINHTTLQHQLSEYMRIDAVVESYKIVLSGHAKMRLTHFIAKLYPKSNRIGMAWGFDSQQGHSSPGSIHRTFSSYNDLRDAIIP